MSAGVKTGGWTLMVDLAGRLLMVKTTKMMMMMMMMLLRRLDEALEELWAAFWPSLDLLPLTMTTLMKWNGMEAPWVEPLLYLKWLMETVTLKWSTVDASEQTDLWHLPTAPAVTYIHQTRSIGLISFIHHQRWK